MRCYPVRTTRGNSLGSATHAPPGRQPPFRRRPPGSRRMPTIKLTQPAVDRLKPPASGRVEYWDNQLPGFGLRVSDSGRKTWVALYRVDGRSVRETIGTTALIPSVADARAKARASMQRAREGVN